jgi:uncharacterized protein (DUF433 family)
MAVDRFATLLYGIGEAAGYLTVPPSTLSTWAYGYERRQAADGRRGDGRPDHAFWRPRFTHGGASVDNVIDLFRAGEPVDSVADEFGLTRYEVEDAIRVVTRAAA